jgi:hypothetical protein
VTLLRDLRRVARREREFSQATYRRRVSEGAEAVDSVRAEMRELIALIRAPLEDDDDDEDGFGSGSGSGSGGFGSGEDAKAAPR